MSGKFEKNYCEAMSTFRFSTTDKDRLCQKLAQSDRDQRREVLFMKKHKIYKIVAAAAICLLLTGVTAFAGGNIVSTMSSHRAGYDYKSAEDLNNAVDSSLSLYPQAFSNGFSFQGGNILQTEGQDSSGNTVESWQELSATYANKDGASINLSLSKDTATADTATRTPSAVKEIFGVELSYNYDEYLFVPADYELSAAEAEREQRDEHFFVSYGTDEVESQYFSSVSFSKDGVSYLLSSFDEVSADTLYAMAAELLQK